jgi:hypothetical protein
MKQNLLKYYIALQPMIKKAMGNEHDEGDWYWYGKLPEIPFELEINIFRDNGRCTAELRGYQGFDIIWRPQLFDWDNPERGLLGMVKDFCDLFYDKSEVWVCRVLNNKKPDYIEEYGLNRFEADTPEEAILKALCEQEGVKV